MVNLIDIIGKTYKHINSGNLYKVTQVYNLDVDESKRKEFPIYIGYARIRDNSYWCRPFDEFKMKFEMVSDKLCENKVNGVCQLHNLFCSYPDCEK